MTYKRELLSDGVYLNHIVSDKFKAGYFSFNIITLLDETTNTQNSLLPLVLMRGTKDHSDISSLKKALDNLYSANLSSKVSKRGDYQIIDFNASWLEDKYALNGENITMGTLELLREVIFEPYTENGRFKNDYFELEKKTLADEINSLINNKTSYAVRRCFEIMGKGKRCGISEYGNVKELEKIKNDELFSRYVSLIRKSRIELFYIGKKSFEEIKNICKEKFVCENRNYEPLPECEIFNTNTEKEETVFETMKTKQGKLSLGFHFDTSLGKNDCSAFPLFSEIYGSSPTSKLFMNVREKMSLCYYCRIVPETANGTMVVSSGIEPDNYEKTKNEIICQLEKMKNGEITEKEMISAKKSIRNGYNELEDSPVSLKRWYLINILAGVYLSPEERLGQIENTSVDEVTEFAKKVKLDTVYFLKGVKEVEERGCEE